ncbi:MAG: EAL domain-containing protein [Magnetococcales bacterium]|nr:EAL domain-containing protein [Magnetococcales bacterium]
MNSIAPKSSHNLISEIFIGNEEDCYNELELIGNQLTDGISVWNSDGNLLYANPNAKKHFKIDHSFQGPINCMDVMVRMCDFKHTPMTNKTFPISKAIRGEICDQDTIVGVNFDNKQEWFHFNVYALPGNSHDSSILCMTHEVSELVINSHDLSQSAYYDSLTGLPNRILLNEKVKTAIAHSKRSGHMLAVCLMDLDGFKPINDTLGHEAGDEVLKVTAERLLESVRGEDTALRLGGDEFVLLINNLNTDDECILALNRVLISIAQPIPFDKSVCSVTASIGVTLFPNDPSGVDKLLRHADQAMYKAKELGKNNFELFDPTLASRNRANQNTLTMMAKALEKKQFQLYYQPQIDCQSGSVVGVEALIRWNHPILGVRSPGEFLPLIEKDDLIIDLGSWVISEAMSQLKKWKEKGISLTIGINISARQLLHKDFKSSLEKFYHELSDKEDNPIKLEILETAALEDMKSVARLINESRKLNFSYALDDFGTGYSSLSHLKHLSVDTLKIDQSYIRDMQDDPGDLAIVQGIIGLSKAFNTEVVAEGVENIDQIMMLIGMGCKVVQGYAIAKPMPSDIFIQWLENYNSNPVWQTAHDRYPSRGQFELLVIEVAHRTWFEQIKTAFRNGEKIPSQESYETCKLTAWYHGDGAEHYSHLTRLHEMDANHRKVHQEHLKLCDQVANHDEISAMLTMGKLTELNNALIVAIHQFRFQEKLS